MRIRSKVVRGAQQALSLCTDSVGSQRSSYNGRCPRKVRILPHLTSPAVEHVKIVAEKCHKFMLLTQYIRADTTFVFIAVFWEPDLCPVSHQHRYVYGDASQCFT